MDTLDPVAMECTDNRVRVASEPSQAHKLQSMLDPLFTYGMLA